MHWRTFLRSLVERGLGGVRRIISDAHPGLQAARQAIFGSVPFQRCQFHLQQNAQSYVPRLDLNAAVAADIRAIFNAPTRAEAETLLGKLVQKYATTAPRLASWAEANLPEGFTVFAFPETHRRRLHTTNSVERINREILCSTRVVGICPNEAVCLRLVSAIAMEISDEWEDRQGLSHDRRSRAVTSFRMHPDRITETMLHNRVPRRLIPTIVNNLCQNWQSEYDAEKKTTNSLFRQEPHVSQGT